jgi:hypothetical protein
MNRKHCKAGGPGWSPNPRLERMSHRKSGSWQRLPAVLLLGGFVFSCLMGSAQESVSSRVKDFTWPEFYDPPHQNQVKSLLAGTEAQPQPDGKFLIKELKLETYRENGELEVIVKAP